MSKTPSYFCNGCDKVHEYGRHSTSQNSNNTELDSIGWIINNIWDTAESVGVNNMLYNAKAEQLAKFEYAHKFIDDLIRNELESVVPAKLNYDVAVALRDDAYIKDREIEVEGYNKAIDQIQSNIAKRGL